MPILCWMILHLHHSCERRLVKSVTRGTREYRLFQKWSMSWLCRLNFVTSIECTLLQAAGKAHDDEFISTAKIVSIPRAGR